MAEKDQKIKYVGEKLSKLVRKFTDLEKSEISCYGVTLQQSFVLLAFEDSQSLTMSEISAKIGVANSTTTRIVDNLVRDKLVIRKAAPGDRRSVIIAPSEKGKRVIVNLQTCYDNFSKIIFSHIPENKIDNVLSSLELLINSLTKGDLKCCR